MDLETQVIFTRICLSADGSKPPTGAPRDPPTDYTPFRAIHSKLMAQETTESEKWNMVFGLLLESFRKIAYIYRATYDTADVLQKKNLISADGVMARQISDDEVALQAHYDDWGAIVGELIRILDDNLSSESGREERQCLLNGFLGQQPE